MKTGLLKSSSFIILIILLISSCEKDKLNGPNPKSMNDLDLSSKVIQKYCGEELETDLYFNKSVMAGKVIVTPNGEGTLKVTYTLLPGFIMTESHLSVTSSLDQVPQTADHNPKVGSFDYSVTHDPPVTSFVYDNIPVGTYILAHATIKQLTGYESNVQVLDVILPPTAKISVTYPVPGGPSYFQTIITEAGSFDGVYEGWCIDVDHVIYQNTPYPVEVYSSYNPMIAEAAVVDFPENFDKVNWVLNQDYVGKTVPDLGDITYGDVQRAVWELLEEYPSSSGLGLWSQSRVDYIIAEAASGEGFIPRCGDLIAIILKPFDTALPVQITISPFAMNYDLVCLPVYSQPETAWAAGYDFGGSSWAKYFTFCY